MPNVDLQYQVVLAGHNSTIAIPYPEGFDGYKSEPDEDRYFSISPFASIRTLDEIQYAREYLKNVMKLPDAKIVKTGAVIGPPDDPLYEFSHEQLNALEKKLGFSNSEFVPSGGQNSTQTRVLLIREQEYEGDGSELEEEKSTNTEEENEGEAKDKQASPPPTSEQKKEETPPVPPTNIAKPSIRVSPPPPQAMSPEV